MKLTPTRRVLLVAALVFWLMGALRISVGDAVFEARPAPVATAVLLIVLMLELRDNCRPRRARGRPRRAARTDAGG